MSKPRPRVFVLEPECYKNSIEKQDAFIRELPSGMTHAIPEDIRRVANSKCALSGKRILEYLRAEFHIANKPVWIVWGGRAINLPVPDRIRVQVAE